MGEPSFHNDIAIIKLKHPIALNDGVQPVCLNLIDQHYDSFLIASGYGATTPQIRVQTKFHMEMHMLA